MKYFFYDILLHVSLVLLFPYFVLKMFTAHKYREGIRERFGFIDREKTKGLEGGPVLWVHAISVGETRAVLPVLKLFKERRPDVKVVFSTVTMTGNRCVAADAGPLIDALIYFPIDISWVIKRVLATLGPSAVVVVEKEVWPNFIRTLKQAGTPLVVVNGTIGERSFLRFKKFGFLFREVFGAISYFSARTAEDRDRAVEAGVPDDRAVVTGNLKFDIRPPVSDNASLEKLRTALGIRSGDRVIVAGSTHAGEEEVVLRAFERTAAKMNGTPVTLVLAPRHPERFNEVEALIKRTGLAYSRRTDGPDAQSAITKDRVVLLDTVGELMSAYSFASIAIVGGSLVKGIGGHNLLEPAYYEKPVLYGAYLTTYASIADMLEAGGGGFRVADDAALEERLVSLLNNVVQRERAGAAAGRVVTENTGAAARTVAVIERFMPKRQQ